MKTHANSSAAAQGWWDSFKEIFSLEYLKKKFNISLENITEAFIYCGIGFVVGLLFKKYFKYLVALILIVGVSMWFFVYLDIVTIDWDKAKAVLGISHTQTVESIWNVASVWLKEHILTTVATLIGFLLGYSFGR